MSAGMGQLTTELGPVIHPPGGAPGPPPPTPAGRGVVVAGSGLPDAVTFDLSAEPPPELGEEIAAAAAVARRLAELHRELRFHKDEHANRIVVEVCDSSGAVLRTIPPTTALALMTGGLSPETVADG